MLQLWHLFQYLNLALPHNLGVINLKAFTWHEKCRSLRIQYYQHLHLKKINKNPLNMPQLTSFCSHSQIICGLWSHALKLHSTHVERLNDSIWSHHPWFSDIFWFVLKNWNMHSVSHQTCGKKSKAPTSWAKLNCLSPKENISHGRVWSQSDCIQTAICPEEQTAFTSPRISTNENKIAWSEDNTGRGEWEVQELFFSINKKQLISVMLWPNKSMPEVHLVLNPFSPPPVFLSFNVWGSCFV